MFLKDFLAKHKVLFLSCLFVFAVPFSAFAYTWGSFDDVVTPSKQYSIIKSDTEDKINSFIFSLDDSTNLDIKSVSDINKYFDFYADGSKYVATSSNVDFTYVGSLFQIEVTGFNASNVFVYNKSDVSAEWHTFYASSQDNSTKFSTNNSLTPPKTFNLGKEVKKVPVAITRQLVDGGILSVALIVLGSLLVVGLVLRLRSWFLR